MKVVDDCRRQGGDRKEGERRLEVRIFNCIEEVSLTLQQEVYQVLSRDLHWRLDRCADSVVGHPGGLFFEFSSS